MVAFSRTCLLCVRSGVVAIAIPEPLLVSIPEGAGHRLSEGADIGILALSA